MKSVLPSYASSDPRLVVAIVPDETKTQVENDLILLQRSSQLGISASDQEVDTELAKNLNITVNQAGQPVDRNAYEAALRLRLQTSGLSLSQYREQIRAQLLKTKVQDKLAADLPKTAPEVKYAEIMMNTEPDAKRVVERLKGSESWDSIVADVRKTPTIGTVAEFDFQPKEQVDDKLAPALFALKPNEATDVVKTGDGKFTIARLTEKDETHEMTDGQRKAKQAVLSRSQSANEEDRQDSREQSRPRQGGKGERGGAQYAFASEHRRRGSFRLHGGSRSRRLHRVAYHGRHRCKSAPTPPGAVRPSRTGELLRPDGRHRKSATVRSARSAYGPEIAVPQMPGC